MATTDDTPVDTRDALEVLESEAKEWDKVKLQNNWSSAIETDGALANTCAYRMLRSIVFSKRFASMREYILSFHEHNSHFSRAIRGFLFH